MPPYAADDYYAVLGVTRTVSPAELRRAYRQLALAHHPDVAGDAATERFQKIAEAYRVLSDPESREEYDAQLRGSYGFDRHGGGFTDPPPWQRKPARPVIDDLIERLSGPLETLIARGVVRRLDDGTLEILLARNEAAAGGTAAIDASLPVPCPTCCGLAQPHRLWCTRCEYAGTVIDNVTVCVPIPAFAQDGTTFQIPLDPTTRMPPLRVRLRV